MARTIRVIYTDGRAADAVITPRAEVETERHYGMSILESSHVEHFYYLAWAVLHFSGRESAPFDDFLATVADVETVKEEASDPTQSGLRPVASSN